MIFRIGTQGGKTFDFPDVTKVEMIETDHGINYDVYCENRGPYKIGTSSVHVVIRVDRKGKEGENG